MREISTRSWAGLKNALVKIDKEKALMAQESPLGPSKLLYRGQSNAAWSLSTTLERWMSDDCQFSTYYRKILVARPQVESFSGRVWELVNLERYREWERSADDFWLIDFPGYDYMIYLRHHGFPSPLLDWSRSPFVAAYFAFSNIPKARSRIALYCYMEYGKSGKSHRGNEPHITTKGPFVRSHKRHFVQQCEYTICTKRDGEDLFYTNHEDVFDQDHEDQDYLWKITAPSSIATEALGELDRMNINALSLFGSEDALVETMAVREFVLK